MLLFERLIEQFQAALTILKRTPGWVALRPAPIGAALALCVSTNGAWAQVGQRHLQVGTLDVTMTYPTAAIARPQALGSFNLQVAMGAEPLEQQHRLVVISHGSVGNPVADHALANKLAQAGFVVAQQLHEGDNFRDRRWAGPEAFRQRPTEAMRVVEALSKDPLWSSRLALDKVGVHGMSAGGVTGIALAGGQWRLLNLVRHCNDHAQADEGFCFQGAKEGEARAHRQANHDRARGMPEWLLPSELKTLHGGKTPLAAPPESGFDPRPDPRVAAVSLAVPVAAIFSPESLARIRIPVGVVSADRDEVLVPRFHTDHLLRHCSTCTRLANLSGAGHFDVLWPWPDAVARAVGAQQVRGGLPVPGFDARQRDGAHDRIVAFHRQHLLPLP